MGVHEGWVQPNRFHPNGLFPNEADSVTRLLDPERWSIAEGRTAELIACIQPNQPSEERRNAVLNYVQRLITRSFSCEVFTFGSVPLKTYLPDGDIDLTAFSKNQNLKDTWANEVRDMLESEEKREDAEFRVKEVQYIQAEVKIIKCLVENIVVDISFNQLGGLCTLCFLEQVDCLINQNHLFKRSIILIKAWCYYESRILGAHHGLISTYALETLVLYIFHVFNNSFAGPLEVLYRFLEFFSKFDWDNFCISLWGPVPIRSLPDMTANSPRKDGGELLLNKGFLDVCSTVYSVFPGGQENHELPFISKHFNVIDPLRTNNNLGRSVSKGNFFRIRSAFAFGAQQLARLLDCPKENIIFEVNQFFMNTWDRHGKGHRPDAPNPFSANLNHIVDGLGKYSSHKKEKENSTSHESDVEVIHASHGIFSKNANPSLKQISRTNNAYSISLTQSQKPYANLTSSVAPDQNCQMTQNISSNEIAHTDKGRSARPDNLGNKLHARYQFARTHSSPELTDTSSEVLYRGRRIKASQTTKGQTTSTRLDHSRRMNLGSEVSENNSALSLAEDLPSSRQGSIRCSAAAAAADLNSVSNYHGESGLGAMGEDRPSAAEALQMHQDEQDLVNMMGFSRVHSFSGHVQTPVNLASAHQPIPISPSILASLGYGHRFPAGMVPTIVPSFEPPWGSNMHYSQGSVSSPGSQYISTVGIASNHEEIVEPIDNSLEFKETCHENSDHGLWSERCADSLGEFDPDNGSFQVQQLGGKNKVTLTGFPVVPSSQVSSSEVCSMKDHASVEENRGLIRECFGEDPHYQKNGGSGAYTTSSRIASASSRTKQSSESSSDGSSSKNSKSMAAGMWGRKLTPNEDRSTLYKNGWQYESESVDHVSSRTDDDNRDWIRLSTVDNEVAESDDTGAISSLLQSHQISDSEPAQTSGSNSVLPVAPMFADYGSRQRATDNSGMLPFAFYPTGPPVPFVTMLPFYGLPEPGTSDASTSHLNRDEEFNNPHSGQSDRRLDENLGLPDVSSHSNLEGTDLAEPSEDHKPDILNSDITSHWQNLQYGRLCQNPQIHGPTLYPSSVVPPMYMQGHFPWGSPGRPLSANANLFTQLMGYGPRIIPVSPLQSGSNRPTSVHQYYGEEIPRYRGGTGTYLPNPKIGYRERQSSNTRNNRGSYSYDRKDQHGDREGNWINSKQRFANRGEGHNQFEKPNARIDRGTASNSRSNRPRDSFRPDSFPSNRSQNGPFNSSNSIHHGPPNVAYGMFPLQVINPTGVSPSGTAMPSVVMLYPYEQNMGCVSPAEQLEFGSLGPVRFSGMNEVVPLGEGSSNGVNEKQHYRVDSSYSSPDQPSSPMLQR